MGLVSKNFYFAIRWGTSILFFFLGILKIQVISEVGLEPYEAVVKTVSAPGIFEYYGVLATLIELFVAIGIWFDMTYKSSICFMFFLSVSGIVISIYSLIFKLNSDCGCGLLGDNEYGLLLQKLVIIFILGVLYKKKHHFFPEINDNTQV